MRLPGMQVQQASEVLADVIAQLHDAHTSSSAAAERLAELQASADKAADTAQAARAVLLRLGQVPPNEVAEAAAEASR